MPSSKTGSEYWIDGSHRETALEDFYVVGPELGRYPGGGPRGVQEPSLCGITTCWRAGRCGCMRGAVGMEGGWMDGWMEGDPVLVRELSIRGDAPVVILGCLQDGVWGPRALCVSSPGCSLSTASPLTLGFGAPMSLGPWLGPSCENQIPRAPGKGRVFGIPFGVLHGQRVWICPTWATKPRRGST